MAIETRPACTWHPQSDYDDLTPHPLGRKARVLLSGVFGPYACDDQYGSRTINPMELYHNQVTRVQGAFSLRMFHRTWGLMLIQANIDAPCTVLDFPTRDRFVQQITETEYDIIGISAIMPNVGKVEEMCRLIREHQPEATIVIGGHIANMGGLADRLDADHIVAGDGIRWFRQFLGQPTDRPIHHPAIRSGLGARAMGINLGNSKLDIAATLIPSVGCPMGCNFCSTSAMFGGKGKSVVFYETGDELFDVMVDIERQLGMQAFFVMDENFLLHRKRAMRLLELMQQHNKAWALYVFSSANVLRSYTMDELVALGISWVWMGLEGRDSQYSKLKGMDTLALVREFQEHGIRVLGSSIIGLEEHTPDNIDAAIDYAVEHDTEFHQFMLYTPIPGTPLWTELERRGDLTDPQCLDVADTHGQSNFNYRHAHLPPGSETEYLLEAFRRDFRVNGPSITRVIRTTLRGYRRYRHHPDARIRARFRFEARGLITKHAGALWAARKWFKDQPQIRRRLDETLQELYGTFGIRARLLAPLVGRYIFRCLTREQQRLDAGWTYEPPTICQSTNLPDPSCDPTSRRSGAGYWLRPAISAGG
jgi:hypothetical protein